MHPAINFLPRRLRKKNPHLRWVTTFHDLLPPYLFPKAGPLRERVTRILANNSDVSIATNERDLEQSHHRASAGTKSQHDSDRE